MSKDSLQSPKARKLGYSSQLAFVISLIAGSVGTGNIWRFPRVAAANGGAFVLAYIIMMFIVIIPVMMGEHFMGRRSRRVLFRRPRLDCLLRRSVLHEGLLRRGQGCAVCFRLERQHRNSHPVRPDPRYFRLYLL